MSNFTEQAKGMYRNPLGIIALFLSLIYVLACLVLGSIITKLSASERLPLIWFIVIFPILILLAFYHLVTTHHTKLYAPIDFKNEENFILSANKRTFTDQNFRKSSVNQDISGEEESLSQAMISLLAYSSFTGIFALYAVKLSIEK